MIPFNKVVEIEDFDDPGLASVMREVCAHKVPHLPGGYPKGAEHRKDWEVATDHRALDHVGARGPEAIVLEGAAGAAAEAGGAAGGGALPVRHEEARRTGHGRAGAALSRRHVRRDLLLG